MRSIFLYQPDPLELRLRTSGWRQATVWLPVLLALAVIATESTGTFSGAHTSSWLRPIAERLFGIMSDSRWGEVHHLIRKTGHFCGYGLLVCLAFLRAWLLQLGRLTDLGRTAWRWRSCLMAVFSTAVIASLDEWHQSFLPSRTGKASDVLLDTCGAVSTCALVWFFVWRRRKGQTSRWPVPARPR